MASPQKWPWKSESVKDCVVTVVVIEVVVIVLMVIQRQLLYRAIAHSRPCWGEFSPVPFYVHYFIVAARRKRGEAGQPGQHRYHNANIDVDAQIDSDLTFFVFFLVGSAFLGS